VNQAILPTALEALSGLELWLAQEFLSRHECGLGLHVTGGSAFSVFDLFASASICFTYTLTTARNPHAGGLPPKPLHRSLQYRGGLAALPP
jgi:hypothetical protein